MGEGKKVYTDCKVGLCFKIMLNEMEIGYNCLDNFTEWSNADY